MLTEAEIYQKVANHQLAKNEALLLLKQLYQQKEGFALIPGLDTVQVTSPGSFGEAPPVHDDSEGIQTNIIAILIKVLHLSEGEISATVSFKDLGVDSISGVEIIREINRTFGLNLDAVVLYDYSNLITLTQFVGETLQKNHLTFGSISRSSEIGGGPKPLKNRDQVILKTQPVAFENERYQTTELAENGIPEPQFDDFELVSAKVSQIVGKILHLAEAEINLDSGFKELGVDSISGVEIVRDINRAFGLNLDAVAIYDYASIHLLTGFILQESRKNEHILDSIKPTVSKQPATMEPAGFGQEPSRNFSGSLPEPKDRFSENMASTGSGTKDGPASPKSIALKPVKQLEPAIQPAGEKARVPQETFSGRVPLPPAAESRERRIREGIAVIGMSGRFPGARDIHQYWENLKHGIDSIIEVPQERFDVNRYYDPNPLAPIKTYCKLGGYLEDIDKFDPLFFNISPKEAELMDPQQRLFLEEAWRALEDAGYSDRTLSNLKCGVFAGATQGDYGKKLEAYQLDTSAEAFTGLASSILAARISYFLNLTGPSIAIDTACSSSLVAIHQACQSILNDESDMALAGGVMLMLTPDLLIRTSKMGMISPSGKCRTFDQSADGTVFSEGVGVVVLKSLDRALEDRDYIYGVIRGSGLNQDGKTNGITAPSALSQTKLELDVYRRAGVNPQQISYIEAHGTGTPLGDPIEVKALKEAFQTYTPQKQFCAIGSVKTNIGHTTMAAGVASVIKVLLALQHKQIPPLLHFKKENEHINFQETPFYLNTHLQAWDAPKGMLRMSGVSAFGFSGTNCHLLIEEI
jgi:3-oxoacyl-(acyl-carrier-protein) synthase/acyl carrier protein